MTPVWMRLTRIPTPMNICRKRNTRIWYCMICGRKPVEVEESDGRKCDRKYFALCPAASWKQSDPAALHDSGSGVCGSVSGDGSVCGGGSKQSDHHLSGGLFYRHGNGYKRIHRAIFWWKTVGEAPAFDSDHVSGGDWRRNHPDGSWRRRSETFPYCHGDAGGHYGVGGTLS